MATGDNPVDSTPINPAHTAQYRLFTSAERIARAWRKAHGLQCHLCAPEKSRVIWCCTCLPFLFSHLPFTTSTSSSSFTLPSTTTQEHALQSGQDDLLQEHPVHHQHLQDLPVDKRRHQEPPWRENLQSGGSPCITSSTACDCLKDLENNRSTSMFMVHREFGERDQVPINEEVKEFVEIGAHGLPDSEKSKTSYLQSHMHFDESAESSAVSDLEDGELQKMLTSPVYAQKASEKTLCIGGAGERWKCTIDSSRKRKFDLSLICMPRKRRGNPTHFHLSRET